MGWSFASHTMLESIETTLRGLITAQKLTILKQGINLYEDPDMVDWRQPGCTEYFTPFQDHVLDYEFVDPELSFNKAALEVREKDYLSDYVSSLLFKELVANLSKLKLNRFQADQYVEMWFKGGSPEQCVDSAFICDRIRRMLFLSL